MVTITLDILAIIANVLSNQTFFQNIVQRLSLLSTAEKASYIFISSILLINLASIFGVTKLIS